ncbi:acid phosphatase-like protein [Ophiocordyceps camponoti-floridani]|uniref:Acid phosphatase-like protein n=1 Tax=Ophiocordyceps camponoti-floridani TaxID=2030778 RepID=A0A8H4Q6H0_9HYPO|nr:acid phosphatase-like protein [Ophiocordyceps camponoti-floridani]
MVSTIGGIFIALLVLIAISAAGWFVFGQLRARKLGLPPPSLSSYLPWRHNDDQYGPPRPAPGGVVGWFNDQFRRFKDRNNRSAAGAYEHSLRDGGGRGRRGFGPLDPDEAWDARVGHEADGYGYYEEQELSGSVRGHSANEYSGGGSYSVNLGPTQSADPEGEHRGRPPTRSPVGQRNPFDDEAGSRH